MTLLTSTNLQLAFARDYLLSLRDFAVTRGITSEQLLEGVRADVKTLVLPPERIDAELMYSIGRNLVRQLDKPFLESIEFGDLMMESSHGMLVLAIRGSENLLEAGKLLLKYAETRSNTLSIFTKKKGEDFVFRLVEVESLRPLDREGKISSAFFALSLMKNIFNIGYSLLKGNYLSGQVSINLNFPVPTYADEIPESELLKIQFDQGHFEIVVPYHWMLLPLNNPDPELTKVALDEINEELKKINPNNLVAILSGHLSHTEGVWPTVDTMAGWLNMSVSTLQRRLSEQGTSYSKLSLELRVRRSKELLAETDMLIERISSELGFEDPSNFSKFVKRHLGITPIQYRNSNHNL